MKRDDVTFEVGGTPLAAWWYTPEAPQPPYATVVMGHGFGGTRPVRLDAFASRFAEAGFAVLVFDYRNFGDSGGEARQVLDIGMQLEDWRGALAYARGRQDVDSARIALWGTSFGGGHVLSVAASDHDVAAVVSQAPFVDGRASMTAGPMSPRTVMGLLGAAVADSVGARFGRPPRLVPIVGPPGSVAAMTTADAEEGYRMIVPADAEFVNGVAARIILAIPGYRPGRRATSIICPVLFCVADHDSVAPAAATVEAAGRAPKGTLIRYDCKHFDVYVGEWFKRVIDDQVAFLRDHLA